MPETKPPEPASPQETPPAEPEAPPVGEPKTLTIPTSSMASIKEAEREKGRKAALDELNLEAQKAGFSSWAEMAAEATKKKATPEMPKKPVKKTATTSKKAAPEAAESAPTVDVRRLQADYQRVQQLHANEVRARKQATAQLEALQAESELRVEAVRHGVQDVDYALHLVRKSLSGQTPKDLAAFDAKKFFRATLKSTHPTLYEATVIPATTGTESKGDDAAKASAADEASKKAPPVKRAKDMTVEEYRAGLAKLGLHDPSSGVH